MNQLLQLFLPVFAVIVSYLLAIAIFAACAFVLGKVYPATVIAHGQLEKSYLPLSALMWIPASAAATLIALSMTPTHPFSVLIVLGALLSLSSLRCYFDQRPAQPGLLTILWISCVVIGIVAAAFFNSQV